MGLKDWLPIVIAIPAAVVSLVSISFSFYIFIRERTHKPRIQFDVECRLYGPEHDYYLIEFLVSAHNKGRVQHKFKSIHLRVRGIEAHVEFSEWQGNQPRIEFPLKLIDKVQIIPDNLNFLFVEPDVVQTITYIARLPISIKYILVNVLFEYDKYTPHTTERVFQIGQEHP